MMLSATNCTVLFFLHILSLKVCNIIRQFYYAPKLYAIFIVTNGGNCLAFVTVSESKQKYMMSLFEHFKIFL